MNCDRAVTILQGLLTKHLEADHDELDELLKAGLVVEADPAILELARRIEALRGDYPEFFHDATAPREALQHALEDVEKKLKNDWYRMRTSNASLAEQEENRVQLRRTLGEVADPETAAVLQRTTEESGRVAQGALYLPCPAVGRAVYAITRKGHRALGELATRIARFAGQPLSAFLKPFEKVDAKMRAFSREVTTLSDNVGYVRKGKTQVVIGLVKTGLPAQQALGVYQNALQGTRAPDVAVTCARNAAQEGSPAHVVHKLGACHQALLKAGFPNAPIVQGAAKALLPFSPPSAGIPRFVEIFNRMKKAYGQSDDVYKFTARLMPASGTPAEVVGRVMQAARLLGYSLHGRRASLGRASVALASMVREDAAIPGICTRFVEIERGLVAARLCGSEAEAEAHALECVACPGTPQEVVAVVGALCRRLASGGRTSDEALTIGAAFAKRFAY
jgi:hypothetical protein